MLGIHCPRPAASVEDPARLLGFSRCFVQSTINLKMLQVPGRESRSVLPSLPQRGCRGCSFVDDKTVYWQPWGRARKSKEVETKEWMSGAGQRLDSARSW